MKEKQGKDSSVGTPIGGESKKLDFDELNKAMTNA